MFAGHRREADSLQIQPKTLFSALEGWRGFCALGIAVLHFPSTTFLYAKDSFFISNFYLFVDFFFVLSGFVITYAYGKRLKSWLDVWTFMLLRFWRLYPVHVFVLALLILFQFVKWYFDGFLGGKVGEGLLDNESLSSIVTHLLLVHSLGFTPRHQWNGPSWSISTEFYTYILFAAVMVLTRSADTMRKLAIFALVAGSLTVLILYPGKLDVVRDYGIFRCIYGFGIGYFTFLTYQATREYLDKRPVWLFNFLEITAVIMLLVQLVLFRIDMVSLVAPALFAIFVLVFAFERGVISSFFSNRSSVYLGKLSYSIYMVHGFVILSMNGVLRIVQRFSGEDFMTFTGESYLFGTSQVSGLVWFLIYVMLVIAASHIVHAFLENPLRRFGRRRSNLQGQK